MAPKKRNLLLLCLGLSLGWHFLGALAIGTVEEPVPVPMTSNVPLIALRPPVEMLSAGVDESGARILRPVLHYQDPEFFGYPRALGVCRHRAWMRGDSHQPALPPQAQPKPEIEDNAVMAFGLKPVWQERVPSAIPREQEPAFEKIEREIPAVVIAPTKPPRLMLFDGPLLKRACLINVQPVFERTGDASDRTLVLGERAKAGPEGLKIRLWADAEGTVRLLRLESSCGNARWDQMAMQALRQWRFAKAKAYAWGRAALLP